MKKITFLTSLLFGLFLSLSINAQTTIEFESATSGDGTPSMTSTELPGVTITFTAAVGNIDVPNGAGIGGSSGKVVYTSTGDLSQSMTVSFSAAVDIVSLQHFDPFDAFSETLTFTPTGGSNSLVTSTHPATGGATATLNWTGVTSFTITGSTLAGHYAIDKLQLSIAAPIICSAPTAQATSAVFGTETSSTLNITSFTAPVGGADGYSIFINDTNSFTVPVDGDEPTGDLTWNDAGQQPVYFGTSASPNITVSDLDPGTTYYYQVYAYNDCSGTETYETTGLSSSDTTALGELTITGIYGLNKVYNGTTAANAYGFSTLTGVLPGDDVTIVSSPVFTFVTSNVGTGITITTTGYSITGIDAGKYTLTQPTLSANISPAPLTVIATSGISKVYGATDPALTYTFTGFVNGNTEGVLDTGVSISRVSGENVGMYTVTPSGAADSNYSISFVTTTFSITRAPLTVTATSGISKVYGAIDPALTYTITGFVSGNEEGDLDTGVSISRVSGENAGMYTVTPSGAADSNYSISFVTTTFSILSLVDLAVSIDVLNDPLVAGGDALETFRVSVTNNGPSAATGVELSLTSELPIGVSFTKHVPSGGSYNDEVWAVDALAAGNSKTLTFTVQAGADAVSGTDVVPLEFEVSGVNESQSSTANDAASAAISIISIEDTASIEVAATIERQNGLFIGQVTVTNQNDEAIPAFRLYVKNLPEDVQVYNANGTELYGTPAVELPYLLYNYPLAKEASVTISVEFFRPSMDPDFTPDYDVELLAVPETVPAAGTSGVAVTLFKELSNGDILIEVASIPGHDYAIEYSANMNAWNRVPQTLNAPANRLQWIDNGPPKTLVHPSTVPQRFYRLVDLTAGTN